MSYTNKDSIVLRVDSDGNTLQEVLTSDLVNFENGVSVSGDLNVFTPSGHNYNLKVNGSTVFQVTPSGDVTFNNNVILNLGTPVSGSSAVNKDYVDTRDGVVSGAFVSADIAVTSAFQAADTSMSGVLKSYTDTRDGVISGALYGQLTTYSGFAEQRFVNVSGDIMTGSLTLSGGNLLAGISGTPNVGASGTPYGNIYANNLYDGGNDPSIAGQLANKQYVDSKIAQTSGTFNKTVSIDFSYASSNFPYIYSQDTTPNILAWFYFLGSNLFGNIGVIKAVGSVGTAGASGTCLVRVDSTNAVIASGIWGEKTNNVFDLTVISGNVPTTEVLCHTALYRSTGTGKVQLNSLHIRKAI